ncbi:MAG: hypothetical protein MJ176_00685 [Treponema sp.]|nr:hypothetical protein [Treponema sp.]
MERKLYFFAYEINNNEADLLVKLKELGDVCPCLPKGYFICTNENDDIIFNSVKPIFDKENGRFIIMEVDKDKMNGWISTETIDWLKKTN